MENLMIMLPVIALLIWVLKIRSYSDSLFLIAVTACIFTFGCGYDFIITFRDASWKGVILMLASLVALLATAIAFKILTRRNDLLTIEAKKNSKLEAEQAGTGQPATRPESKSEGSDKPQPEAEGRSR
jgi:hypothetical protein